MSSSKTIPSCVRIGCSSAFWGDTRTAAHQLVHSTPDINYLVADYLAEVTMAILARIKQTESAKGREGGYVREFVHDIFKSLAKEIDRKKIKVVTNAGGLNPVACKEELEKVIQELGLNLKVAAVSGDNLSERVDELKEKKTLLPFTIADEEQDDSQKNFYQADLVMSCNAYLGAVPIAKALQRGADVVITGRCVDSALVLGPLLYEFDWLSLSPDSPNYWNLLSGGSLAGHLVECGGHVTGGNFTDWRLSAAGWHNMGFPIAECFSDGSFVITKPPNTGGVVNLGTVGEQLLYEIQDPYGYILPDVICDWSGVTLKHIGIDRVHVSGARGSKPTNYYKTSSTVFNGYMIELMLFLGGLEAKQKAEAVAENVLKRTSRLLEAAKLPPFIDTNVEVLGSEFTYGKHSRLGHSREVLLRLSAHHSSQKALTLLMQETIASATNMAPGITGGGSGRPAPRPMIKHVANLIHKNQISVTVHLPSSSQAEVVSIGLYADDTQFTITNREVEQRKQKDEESLRQIAEKIEKALNSSGSTCPQSSSTTTTTTTSTLPASLPKCPHSTFTPTSSPATSAPRCPVMSYPSSSPSSICPYANAIGSSSGSSTSPLTEQTVPLIALCYGRSGDKGDTCNIGLMSRCPASYAFLSTILTEETVSKYLEHVVKGKVKRYLVPGLNAFNFVCTKSLGGGGTHSLTIDRQGKAFAQMLLSMPIRIPAHLASSARL